MHLVTRVFNSVISKNPDLFDDIKVDWYRQILRLIGLLHDVGHAPFSHASEKLFVDGREHEDYTRDIILNTEIADLIKAIGSKYRALYGQDYDITPELVWMVYEGKDILNEKYIIPDFQFLKSFMDGELDCDKMDYLLRDSYYCGVKYGSYDLDRLVSSFTVYAKDDENILLLSLERGGIHALEEFVLARYFMFIQVYYHKTRRLFDKRLLACLEEILPNGHYPNSVGDYLEWDDAKVIHVANEKKDSSIAAKDFVERRTMACVYQTNVHVGTDGAKLFRLIENSIKDALVREGISEQDLDKFILIDDDMTRSVHKISEGLDDEKAIPIIIEHQKEPGTVYTESLLLRSLTEPISIKRIYVAHQYQGKAEEIIDKCNG